MTESSKSYFTIFLLKGSVKKSCQHNLCDSFLTPKLHSKLKIFLPDELKRQNRQVGMNGWHSGMYLKILSAWGCMVECENVMNLEKRRYYLFSHCYLLSKKPGLFGDLLLRHHFTLYEHSSTHSGLHQLLPTSLQSVRIILNTGGEFCLSTGMTNMQRE